MRSLASLSVVIGLASFAAVSSSHTVAALQIRPGTGRAESVAAGNDYPFLAEPFTITRNGVLETTGAGRLTFEYLGYESGWTSSFLVDGESCFRTGRSAVGATCQAATSGGIVDFQFRTSLDTDDPDAAVWSNRSPPATMQTYGVGLIQEAPNTFLILWNASSAQNVDDHDDLGVRIAFEPASDPEPDTLGLMLAGMAGAAGFVRRRPRGA